MVGNRHGQPSIAVLDALLRGDPWACIVTGPAPDPCGAGRPSPDGACVNAPKGVKRDESVLLRDE